VAFGFLKKIAKDAVKIGPLAFVPGAGAAVVLATGVAAVGHTHAPIVRKVSATVNRLAKNPVVHAIAQGYTTGYLQANPAFFAKTLVLGAAQETLDGKPLGKAILDQRKKVGSWLASKAQYASQAAGVPPSVTPALTAAAHVASGDPIPKNIVEVASGVLASTVGPEASDALEQGAAVGKQLAESGATPTMMQAVDAAKRGLSPTVAHAFDSGVTLAVGQHLQQKGYGAAHELLPPAPGDSIAGKVVNALRSPSQNLLATAIHDVQRQLPPEANGIAHEAIKHIVANPSSGNLSSTDLAHELGIPEPVARVALASVSHEVPGSPIVHPQRTVALVGRPPPPVLSGAA
jgi:hypothetical protein